MKKGFTLIELLVVVLIIGILSAVALPQYEVAVAKSRLAALVPLGRAVREAQDAFYLANDRYTTQPEELDIEVTCPAKYDCDFSASVTERKFNIQPKNYEGYALTFSYATRATLEGASLNYCAAERANDKAVRICKSFGPDYTETDGAWVRVEIK